jgi:hypothetical protein
MQSSNFRSREARERADAALGRPKKPSEDSYLAIRRRTDEENRVKTERLRTLRLAKEAADREALAAAPPIESKRARKKRAQP